MRLIAISNPRIAAAILDYYRAVQQRSRWLSEDQLLFEELERYEDRLVDEWRRKYNQMLEDAGSSSAAETDQASVDAGCITGFRIKLIFQSGPVATNRMFNGAPTIYLRETRTTVRALDGIQNF